MSEKVLRDEVKSVAFFDFDGTLTTGDTLMPFLKFVVGKPRYYWNLLLVSPVLVGYFLKMIRNDVAKEVVLKRYLAGYHIDKLFALGERFSEEIIPTMLRPEGMKRLRWHQAHGHECVLVSASLDIWLKPWAEQEEIGHILTTRLSYEEGIVRGKLNGNNCYGVEKVNRVKGFLLGEKETFKFAYGDTSGDLPLLMYSDASWILKKNTFVKVV